MFSGFLLLSSAHWRSSLHPLKEIETPERNKRVKEEESKGRTLICLRWSVAVSYARRVCEWMTCDDKSSVDSENLPVIQETGNIIRKKEIISSSFSTTHTPSSPWLLLLPRHWKKLFRSDRSRGMVALGLSFRVCCLLHAYAAFRFLGGPCHLGRHFILASCCKWPFMAAFIHKKENCWLCVHSHRFYSSTTALSSILSRLVFTCLGTEASLSPTLVR